MAEQIQILQRRLEDNFPGQKAFVSWRCCAHPLRFVCYVSVVLTLLFAQCVCSTVCVSLVLLLIPAPFFFYRPGQVDCDRSSRVSLFLFVVLGCALRMSLRPICFGSFLLSGRGILGLFVGYSWGTYPGLRGLALRRV